MVGFSGEHVGIRGYVELRTTFGDGRHAKTLQVRYMVINAHTSYNMIIGRLTLICLGAVVSTLYLTMKYPLDGRAVGVIQADQSTARRCYQDMLKTKPRPISVSLCEFQINALDLDLALDLDPRSDTIDR